MLLTSIVVAGFIMIWIGLKTIRWCCRVFWPKRHAPEEGRRCVCGYLLVGLEIPRCPECGRMIGFDKSPEELGVSEEEMRAEAERRRANRGSANIP